MRGSESINPPSSTASVASASPPSSAFTPCCVSFPFGLKHGCRMANSREETGRTSCAFNEPCGTRCPQRQRDRQRHRMTREQLKQLEKDLWAAANNLRANSDLKSSEYATPVLGLIFLKFADNNYRRHEAEIMAEYQKLKGTRREKKLSDIAIEKCGFYLPDHARYDHLLNLPEKKDIARALKEAMKAIEEYKPELDGTLPKDEYFPLTRTDKTLPKQLLRNFENIPADATGDLFGQIYEYFIAEFARSEGQKGGEFFT